MAGGAAELAGRAQRVLDAAPDAWRGARGRLRGGGGLWRELSIFRVEPQWEVGGRLCGIQILWALGHVKVSLGPLSVHVWTALEAGSRILEVSLGVEARKRPQSSLFLVGLERWRPTDAFLTSNIRVPASSSRPTINRPDEPTLALYLNDLTICIHSVRRTFDDLSGMHSGR